MTEGRLSRLSRSIRDRVAIVTGAGSGMGRATALLFADEGARVAVVDVDDQRVARTVADIVALHGDDRALGVVCDVSDLAAIRRTVAAVVDRWQAIDIIVNNAGISMVTSVFSDDDAFETAWQHTVEVNLNAQVRLVRAALAHLLESDHGRVVNIASTEAIVATGGIAAYSASKAGVTALTRSLAVELGRHGVTVNCICPGPVLTAMTDGIAANDRETYARRRVPVRRYGDPEEVAHMVLNLCLPSSSFVNGATIVVDGGMTIRH
jgi:3-oxoacyl-[acyl-carrier protein] reductase